MVLLFYKSLTDDPVIAYSWHHSWQVRVVCVCVTCQAIGQCVSMINCDISQCDVPGLQPVRAIVTAPHSHSAFELLLCCSNERMFFSTPNPREVVWVCVCSMVSHNVLRPLSLYAFNTLACNQRSCCFPQPPGDRSRPGRKCESVCLCEYTLPEGRYFPCIYIYSLTWEHRVRSTLKTLSYKAWRPVEKFCICARPNVCVCVHAMTAETGSPPPPALG